MVRSFRPIFLAVLAVAFPAAAQTPPAAQPAAPAAGAQTPPAAQPAAPAAAAPAAERPRNPVRAAPPAASAAPQATAATPIPLPTWFNEIDTTHKGEVTRAEFLKYRMKTFDQLDINHDNKLSLEEFLKVAEPPFSTDGPGVPTLEERRARARTEFKTLDTNGNGFVERAEAEALVHAEFNQFDTDRDNKVTEPEVRLVVQREMQREQAMRQQDEARRRQGLVAINDFIDMQLREADRIDKNGDGRITRDEFVAVVAGPPDGPQAQGMPPYELRRQLALRKFQEIDANKDGVLDRVELTGHAVEQFIQMDTNKDHYLHADEFKKAQEAETARVRALIQTLQPAQQVARPAPAPAQAKPAPQQAPSGLAPGLPQSTR